LVTEIKKAVEDCRTAAAGTDPEDLKTKVTDLRNAVMKIGTSLNQQAASSAAGGEGDPAEPKAEEAEFKDKDNATKKD